jgi:hypothetical protein
MAPLPIVKHFDVVKDLSPRFLSGVILFSVKPETPYKHTERPDRNGG